MSYVANFSRVFILLAISCLGRVSSFKYTNCACGMSGNAKNRILGGVDASPHEFPWVVSLLHRNEHRCGGSLISHRYVLTACHCVRDYVSEVTIGIEEHVRDSSDGIRVKISKKIMHEKCGYNGNNHVFDIALVKLKRPVKYSTILSPICLPNPDYQHYEKPVTAVGWGQTDKEGHLPEVLQKIDLNIITYKQCATKYRRNSMTDYLICAHDKNRDACKGDSGGPLMYEFEDDKWELVGVISWGEPCEPGDIPGMYTNVSYFLDWIDRHTPKAYYCSG